MCTEDLTKGAAKAEHLRRLKQEEREQGPRVIFTITDAAGNVVNRVEGSTSAGLHRVAWNLRYASFTGGGGGPFVLPGTYTVSASKKTDEALTPLGEPQTFEVAAIGESTLPRQDPKAVLAFQRTTAELLRAVDGANGKTGEVLQQIEQIQATLKRTVGVDAALVQRTRALQLTLLDVQETLTGDQTRDKRSQEAQISIAQRVRNAARGTYNNTYGPTKTQRREYEIGREQYAATIGTLKKLIDVEFAKLKQDLDKAGVPWTSGRALPALK